MDQINTHRDFSNRSPRATGLPCGVARFARPGPRTGRFCKSKHDSARPPRISGQVAFKRCVLYLMMGSVAGCAITPQQFERNKYSMSDTEFCRAAVDASKSSDYAFRGSVEREANRRSLTAEKCSNLIQESNRQAAIAAAVLLGVVAIAASRKHGGGGYYAPSSVERDHEWDWDLFYNERRALVWACRGVQTGQFADLERCRYKLKVDSRWPRLEAPR